MENITKILEEAEKEYASSAKGIRELSKKYNIQRQVFTGWLLAKNYTIENKRASKSFNIHYFDSIDTEEKAYWLGFLYADGAISSGKRNDIELSLQLSDKEHLQKFKDFIEFGGKLIVDDYRCRVSFKNKKMKQDLIKLGCTPKKSLSLNFPTEEQVPKELISHFIRGYLDGDGCIVCTKKHQSVEILGTKDILEGICLYGNIPIGRIYKTNCKSDKIFRLVTNKKEDILNFCNYIYKDSNVYLERKFKKYKLLIEYFATHGRNIM